MASLGVLLGSLLCQVAPIYRGDDDADPARFLASREALWAMYGHSPRHWFTLLEHSVEGSALTFLETHFDRFGRTPALWTTFKEKFIARFRQDVSVADMWLAIARRTQGESESVVDFVTAMEHMLWRSTSKGPESASEVYQPPPEGGLLRPAASVGVRSSTSTGLRSSAPVHGRAGILSPRPSALVPSMACSVVPALDSCVVPSLDCSVVPVIACSAVPSMARYV
ncbi:hypothetical protein FOCC_FOCC016806, partial [Frankliniella occidentalis]